MGMQISTSVILATSLDFFLQTLGSFLCSFIPMLQMAGITASSTALVFIAMDRYTNVVHAFNKRWNPSPSVCIATAIILWLIILGVSYPLYEFFIEEKVTIVYIINLEQNIFEYVDANICVSFDKENMKTYYIVMVIIIFLPLLVVFIFFYYNIALLVWKHRKPVSITSPKNEISNLEASTSNSEERSKNMKKIEKRRDIKVERKIRTFKIIVTLMFIFIACRLPYFTVFILKLSLTAKKYGLWTWYLNYAFLALHIVNCCLNPLLYTFLNQTLMVWIKLKKSVRDFTWEICCFCFSKGEFDEFERENPFEVNGFKGGRNSKVKFEENIKEIEHKY